VSEKLHQCEGQLVQQRKMMAQIADPDLQNSIKANEDAWKKLMTGKIVY
jgi:hypothetical protein